MTEFKPGDRLRGKGLTSLVVTVDYVGEKIAIVTTNEGKEESISLSELKGYYDLLPDFFEVGKSYRSNEWFGTFDVHHVGHLGATKDGRKYAAGQFISDTGRDPYPWVRENFIGWTEV